VMCLLNWGEAPRTLTFSLARRHTLRELWTGDSLGNRQGRVGIDVGPRDGRVIVCTPA
jgi:hypothetical protein